jgi:hypothetical protein
VLLLSSLSAVPNKKQKQALSLTTETDTAIPTSPKKQQTKRTKTKKNSSTKMKSQLLFLLVLFICAARSQTLPTLEVTGTYYEVGFRVGQTFADRISAYIQSYPTMQKKLLPFYNTDYGKEVLQQYVDTNSALYPSYFEEIQGISDGSGVRFYFIFFLLLFSFFAFSFFSPLSAKRKPMEKDSTVSNIAVEFQSGIVSRHC